VKNGRGNQRHMKHDTQYGKLMINKHENISVVVYWDDVSIPGWKLSR
jgi:hypothetical protein